MSPFALDRPKPVPARPPGSPGGALCVELDGVLVQTNTLVESILTLAKSRPVLLLLLPFWRLRGRAFLRAQLAACSPVDAALLPYRREVLSDLEQAAQDGRPLVLITTSHQRVAQAVAEHLQCFEHVEGSTLDRELDAAKIRSSLDERFGAGNYEIAAHKRRDNPVNRWAAWMRAVRIHQSAKNLLLFVPLLLSHRFLDPRLAGASLIAFVCFTLCASGVYLLNDLLDLEADRRHPQKRFRPIACGRVPVTGALVAVPLITAAAIGLAAAFLPAGFLVVLVSYWAVTIAYSFWLKGVLMIDVVVLATLFTSRIIAGGQATGIVLSPWTLAFSVFVFLSLALVKRYSELLALRDTTEKKAHGRGYEADDVSVLCSAGLASGYLAVLVMALYINSPEISVLYPNRAWLWPLCLVMLYWVSRFWLIAHRGQVQDDPVVFAIKDRVSYILSGIALVLIYLAS